MLPVHSRKPLRVAIFNDGHDTLALLGNWLSSHGHLSLTAKLQEMRTADTQAGEFIRRNAADVVVVHHRGRQADGYGVRPVAAVHRADEIEQGLVIGDGQQLPLTEHPPRRSELPANIRISPT